MDQKDRKKLITVGIIFTLLMIVGTIGYKELLKVSVVDAVYMTVITISTVGYTEIAEMTDAAKIFSIFIIFGGISTVGYAFTNIITLFVEGEFKEVWRLKKMKDRITKLKDHYIICGGGETGRSIFTQFQESNHEFVVIEKDEEKYNELINENVLVVLGDATHEDTLEACGIARAKGLISSLSSDADNVFTVLTARQMHPELYIVSRAIERNSRKKLHKAGANNTVSPNEIGGRRMAALVTKPSVISFLDIITMAGDVELDLESVVLCGKSKMVGKQLREVKIPEQTGLIVLAIKRIKEEKLKFNPSADEILNVGDTLIVVGEDYQIKKLRIMACNSEV